MKQTTYKLSRPKNCGKKFRTSNFSTFENDGKKYLRPIAILNIRVARKTRNNDPCPCGKHENGKPVKFKKCCKE